MQGLQHVFNPKGFLTVGLMDERSRKNAKGRLRRGAQHGASSRNRRKLTLSEVDDLLKSVDDGAIEQRESIDPALMELVFTELTVRQRAILMAVLSGEGSRRTIARRFGISASRLDVELSQALALASEAIQRLRRPPR